MPVSAPADKRFRRSHIRPTRQTSWRRRWLKVAVTTAAVLTLAFGVFGAVGYALSSKRLAIRRIVVTGNSRISTGEVRAVLSDLIGKNVFIADINASRRKLRALPWVAEAEIRRVFPASIAVTVAERRVAMLGRSGDDLFLIDRTGTKIADFGPEHAQFDLPIVDGLVAGGDLLFDPERAALAWSVIVALKPRPDLSNRVSQIDVGDPRNVVLTLKDDPALIRIGTDHFLERLQSYDELAEALRERVPDIDYVDLRYGERVIVRPHVARGSEGHGKKG
jgi:cell division protein FtsQ